MKRISLIGLFAISASLAAPAAAQDNIELNMTANEAVRCYSVYKAVLANTEPESDLFNHVTLRSVQWGMVALGIFPEAVKTETVNMVNAKIKLEDARIRLEINTAKQESKETGSKTMLFSDDLEKCGALQDSHQLLFQLVDDLIRKETAAAPTEEADSEAG